MRINRDSDLLRQGRGGLPAAFAFCKFARDVCRFESRFAADSDASNDSKIADGLFDCRMCKGQSDSRPCHHPVGFATECNGPEVFPSVHTIGNASRLARESPLGSTPCVWTPGTSFPEIHRRNVRCPPSSIGLPESRRDTGRVRQTSNPVPGWWLSPQPRSHRRKNAFTRLRNILV